MNRRLGIVLAAVVLACGCGNPQPSEDPSYEGSDVQAPPINPIRAPFAGMTVAIVPYVNKTLAEHRELGNVAPDIIAAFAIEAGFRVVESKGGQLGEVMDEMNFSQTEFVDPSTAAKIGKMKGAKLVLLGAVTDYRITKAKGKKGVDVLGLVEVGGSEASLVYDCQVSSRLVDVETREVIAADAGTAVKQKYSVSGSKVGVLGVEVEEKQDVETQRESMGKVLKLAFARSLNKIVGQANGRAHQFGGSAPAYPAPAPSPYPPSTAPASPGNP